MDICIFVDVYEIIYVWQVQIFHCFFCHFPNRLQCEPKCLSDPSLCGQVDDVIKKHHGILQAGLEWATDGVVSGSVWVTNMIIWILDIWWYMIVYIWIYYIRFICRLPNGWWVVLFSWFQKWFANSSFRLGASWLKRVLLMIFWHGDGDGDGDWGLGIGDWGLLLLLWWLLLHIVVSYCCCILLLSFWIVRYASENDRWVMIHHHPAVPSLKILTVIFLFILWPRLSMLICYFVP